MNKALAQQIIFPTLPLEIQQENLNNIAQNIDQRWTKLKQKKPSFAPYNNKKSDVEIRKEFEELDRIRQALWYLKPESSPLISNVDFMIAQDILEKGYYRRADNIAFAYNRTDGSYNASTILINGLRFIALQEPSSQSINLFFKLLINHRTSILVRLKPQNEFKQAGSIKYWENKLIKDDKAGVKLLASDDEALRPATPTAIPYFFTEMWKDDNALDIKELYNLLQSVRNAYHGLKDRGPIAIHCASGVGRTGAFIAAYTIVEMLDKHSDPSDISIEEIVLTLALQRHNLVATAEQYIMLYRFIDYYLSLKSS
jgi:protein tyrosine phosphatase